MAHTPRTEHPNQSTTRARPQPDTDSLETDDRGTKPYQKQTRKQPLPDGDPKDDPNYIGDPDPYNAPVRAAEEEIRADEGDVEESDQPLATDDDGEAGRTNETH